MSVGQNKRKFQNHGLSLTGVRGTGELLAAPAWANTALSCKLGSKQATLGRRVLFDGSGALNSSDLRGANRTPISMPGRRPEKDYAVD
ncbi:hypothetical protein TWF481_005480 [Arthrobotrys musiformis]|uniref:Uncharacterized protein n=1 Tax=Arthrobotrys musiformis TaxID=47236 RepID=A0AAV9WDV5_9PEZI